MRVSKSRGGFALYSTGGKKISIDYKTEKEAHQRKQRINKIWENKK
jgi:hypothetical protein